MENEERNTRPDQGRNNTPTIVLIILFSIVLLLLYAGWNLMSDDSAHISDLKSVENVDTDLKSSPNPVEPEAYPPADQVIENTEAEPKETPLAQEKPQKPVEEPVKQVEKQAPKSNYSGETAVHIVKQGETFFKIATNFNTSVDFLKSLNPDIDPSNIKVGVTKVKVPVIAVHTVGPGDILRVVANKYGVTVEALLAANGKTRNFAERGEKLLIPHKNKI